MLSLCNVKPNGTSMHAIATSAMYRPLWPGASLLQLWDVDFEKQTLKLNDPAGLCTTLKAKLEVKRVPAFAARSGAHSQQAAHPRDLGARPPPGDSAATPCLTPASSPLPGMDP